MLSTVVAGGGCVTDGGCSDGVSKTLGSVLFLGAGLGLGLGGGSTFNVEALGLVSMLAGEEVWVGCTTGILAALFPEE